MMTVEKAPVMFISHGSPMWALESGEAGDHLMQLTPEFERFAGVVIISPHWMTREAEVTSALQPETIHDFGGFPEALYQLQYPARGSAEIAGQVVRCLNDANIKVSLNAQRGLDHGAWVPLRFLLPKANIPVVQLSLPVSLSPAQLVELGESLASLRAQNIAVIASGSLTHNLRDMVRDDHAVPAGYVERFQAWARDKVQQRDIPALCQPHLETETFAQAHPSADHYLPLLIAMGASHPADHLTVLQSPIQYGALSMESYLWR
ncbi:DODA-type extradiol aromatic ring-opening family dioxygenase [Amphritea opalescens]|uniref:DODA-type extradiol aromatic ring-opening family dioxygenase n=1 Tax=Amphritea opalescens TaxID=2490544 RepID=UPI0019CF5D81|nr:class III extradiol ring-cleavage dioxygenase [Amphritea opalescens]